MSLADKFNLLNEFNILRIICGVFFIPHIYRQVHVPAALEFFVKAGFKPPATWMYLAGAIETVLAHRACFSASTLTICAASSPSSICWSPPPATYRVTGKLDLGHRRLSNIACSGRSAVSSSPCTPITPAL